MQVPTPALEEELSPSLWPDQVVAVNSFDTWRNEQASQQLRQGYEAAGNTVEASIETAERDIPRHAFMAAERQAYADLNAVAAQREDEVSMEATQ